MAPLIIPGGLIVFITSWLYMESPAPKRPTTFADEVPRSRPFDFIPSGPVRAFHIPALPQSYSISKLTLLPPEMAQPNPRHLNRPLNYHNRLLRNHDPPRPLRSRRGTPSHPNVPFQQHSRFRAMERTSSRTSSPDREVCAVLPYAAFQYACHDRRPVEDRVPEPDA